MTATPGSAPGSLAGLSLEWTGRHHSESGDFAELTTHTVTYTSDDACYVTAGGRVVGEASYTYVRLDEQVGVCIYRPTEYQGRSGVVLNAIFDFAAMTDRAVITADGAPFAVADGVMRAVPTPARADAPGATGGSADRSD